MNTPMKNDARPAQSRTPSVQRRPPARWSALGLVLVLALGQALTQPAHSGGGQGGAPMGRGFQAQRLGPGPTTHFDNRFGHNQYYFNRGLSARGLPPGREFQGRDGSLFWYGGGNWYRWHGGSWVVGAAPFGQVVPFLPPFYSTVWQGGLPYYYANDTYYMWDAAQQGYQVVEPPAGIESQGTTVPPPSNQLFVYPRNGQSEAQQQTDRFECHRWAVQQTGFDPTQPNVGVTAGQASDQRDRYFRAEVACLQARGYSVE
jgi:hypothetical protein